MNIKESVRHKLRGHAGDTDLNLTAVMNVFLILVPFLLITASFVHIAVLELSLPNLDRQSATVQPQKPQSVIFNILLIRQNSFELRSPELKLPELAKKDGAYDWNGLVDQLAQIKTTHPASEDIIISPENAIKYDTIISVMDRCREAGFPNISISG